FKTYSYRPESVGPEGRKGRIVRMAKRIICSNGNHRNRRFGSKTYALAAVMGDFQDIDGLGKPDALLDVAGQERGRTAHSQEQNHRIVVLVVPSGYPCGWWMEDRKRADRLPRMNPPYWNLPFLNTRDQLPIRRRHWIPAQP